MLAGLNNGPGKQLVAWNPALIYDMIFHPAGGVRIPLLKVPTTLLIGDADTTAIGKDVAPPEVKARIGRYDVLGKETANKIPQARLVEFKGMGHAPDGRPGGLPSHAVRRN
jgi:pimeloyl-ACP methyl ester carboxylesterase